MLAGSSSTRYVSNSCGSHRPDMTRRVSDSGSGVEQRDLHAHYDNEGVWAQQLAERNAESQCSGDSPLIQRDDDNLLSSCCSKILYAEIHAGCHLWSPPTWPTLTGRSLCMILRNQLTISVHDTPFESVSQDIITCHCYTLREFSTLSMSATVSRP